MRLVVEFIIVFMIIVLIGSFNLKPAVAQDFSGPIALSTGGAGRGSALGPDAHFMNPAGLAFLQGFFANYLYRYEDFSTNDGVGEWAVQITDAHEGVWAPGALSYQKGSRLISGQRFEETNYQLSVASRIVERFAIGVQGRRWEFTNPGGSTEEIWNFGVGTLVYPLDGWSLGFTSNNILDDHSPYLRPELALGTEVFYQDLFRFRADGIYPTKFNPRKKGILAVGFETLFESGMRLRGGSRWDDVENTARWTAGLGWEGPRLSLHYSFERDFRTERFRQSFDLRGSF